jgi:DNA topoisomerase VI subunit B
VAIRLNREHHTIGRSAEYFSASELEKQHGQPRQAIAAMTLKELVDGAMDAAETTGVAPEIAITTNCDGGALRLSVADNGLRLSAAVIVRILGFVTRTSPYAERRRNP